MTTKIQYADEEFINIVNNSLSIAQVCRELHIRPNGGNYKTIHKKIKSLSLDVSHFTGTGWNVGLRYRPINKPKQLSEILVEDSTYTSSYRLKHRLFDEGIKEKRCDVCENHEWLGKPIPLELHHKNGNNTDNRIENLVILCPNCHSHTDNYRGKNCKAVSALSERREVEYRKFKELIHGNADENLEPMPKKLGGKCAENRHGKAKSCPICGKPFKGKNKYCSTECYKRTSKSKRPSVNELLEKFKEYKSFRQVGVYYSVSDNAVRKWCKTYGIIDMLKDYSRPQP